MSMEEMEFIGTTKRLKHEAEKGNKGWIRNTDFRVSTTEEIQSISDFKPVYPRSKVKQRVDFQP